MKPPPPVAAGDYLAFSREAFSIAAAAPYSMPAMRWYLFNISKSFRQS